MMDQSDKKSDAEVEMLEQFEKLQLENESIKADRDRLQKLLDEVTSSNDNQRICQCGRKMRYMSLESKKEGIKCGKCMNLVESCSNVWWCCQECSQYVCAKCEGYKRSVCPYSHFLEFKKYNADIQKQQQQGEGIKPNNKMGHKCDICGKQIAQNYYTCTCGFDMCKKCRQK